MKSEKKNSTPIPWVPFIVVAVASVVFACPAHAGRYELVKGKGVEVCEAYGKNLNSFTSPVPMTCERQINPEMKDFKKPEWKELDAWENREMVKNVELFLGNPHYNPKDDLAQWESGIKDRVSLHHLRIELAQVDIDNDEKKGNVVKYYSGLCTMTRHYGAPLLVLGEDKSYVDIKTAPLMQNPHESIYPLSAGWEYAMYDVFIYKNKVYFDRW